MRMLNFKDVLRECVAKIRAAGKSDAYVLHFLNATLGDDLERMHEATQARVQILRRIIECTEGGKVAIVVGGMDCDCVEYTGHVHVVPADDFWSALDMIHYQAEGRISWSVERPSRARAIKSTSVDRAFEAYENGHPHVVFA